MIVLCSQRGNCQAVFPPVCGPPERQVALSLHGPESKNFSLSSLFNTPQLATLPLWRKSGRSQHTRAVFRGDDMHTQTWVSCNFHLQ